MTATSRLARSKVDSTRHASRRAWWALVVLGVAQLMIVVDTTIVATALPSAQEELGFSIADRQWVVSAYALAFGSLLLIGGTVTDRIGLRRALVVALAGFAVASGIAGAAPGFAILVAARAAQGAFAALLAPAVLSIITTIFAGRPDRGQAFGVFGAIGGGGAALGLLLGGVLTDTVGWRWTMYVNIAFAVVAILGATVAVPRLPSVTGSRIDAVGAVLIGAGLFAIVAGVSRAETDGWTDARTLLTLVVGCALVATFVRHQKHSANPLLPLRVIRDRDRAGGLLALFTGVAGMFAAFLLLTYYLQASLGYTAVQSGLAFLPLSGSVIIVAGASGALGARIPPRTLLPVGLLLGAIALLLLTRLGTDPNYPTDVLPSMTLLGAGLGLIYGVAIELGTRGLPPADAGIGSAVVNSVQQIGGSLGAALFSTVSAAAAASALADGVTSAQANVTGAAVAFACGAAIFAAGAAVTFAVIRPRNRDQATGLDAPGVR